MISITGICFLPEFIHLLVVSISTKIFFCLMLCDCSCVLVIAIILQSWFLNIYFHVSSFYYSKEIDAITMLESRLHILPSVA